VLQVDDVEPDPQVLQRLGRAAPPRLRQALGDILEGVAETFDEHRLAAAPGGSGSADSAALAAAIDRALAACAAEVEGEPRRLGLAALVGLRRNLSFAGPTLPGAPA
jgi:hypothetical protein